MCGHQLNREVYSDSRDEHSKGGKTYSEGERKKKLSSAIVSLRSAQLYNRNREDMLSTLTSCLSVMKLPVCLEMDVDIQLSEKELELISLADQLIENSDKKGFITIQRPEIYLRMGNAFFVTGKQKKALEYYDKVAKDYPRNKEALYNKALTLFSLDKYDRSLKVLDKLLKIDPGFNNAIYLKEMVRQMDM